MLEYSIITYLRFKHKSEILEKHCVDVNRDFNKIRRTLHTNVIIGENCALIVGVNATSLGLMEAPGNWGADIVVGEGQALGIGATAGGPLYGLFACTDKYLRKMPGRIVGKTIDEKGIDAFTLTLSTREQHIRRHKATSNICSNETLIALMGGMHMALLGPTGLERLALRNAAACQVARKGVLSLEGVELVFSNSSSYIHIIIYLSIHFTYHLKYQILNFM